jgi:hypothetical protein
LHAPRPRAGRACRRFTHFSVLPFVEEDRRVRGAGPVEAAWPTAGATSRTPSRLLMRLGGRRYPGSSRLRTRGRRSRGRTRQGRRQRRGAASTGRCRREARRRRTRRRWV